MPESQPNIAIAGQDGGRLAAFEAGALTGIVNEMQRGERRAHSDPRRTHRRADSRERVGGCNSRRM